jgi:hypothetical protein
MGQPNILDKAKNDFFSPLKGKLVRGKVFNLKVYFLK